MPEIPPPQANHHDQQPHGERPELPAEQPQIRVLKGNPTPEELAAALAVVRARAVGAAEEAAPGEQPVSEWSNPARLVPRRLPQPGPGAWRSTYWPG